MKTLGIGILGYGSQGHAHAQNLRDSGCQVIVAEAEGSSGWDAAKEAGFRVLNTAEIAKEADIIVMLAPDQLQKDIYRDSIKNSLASGNTLVFAHGFNIHFAISALDTTIGLSTINSITHKSTISGLRILIRNCLL